MDDGQSDIATDTDGDLEKTDEAIDVLVAVPSSLSSGASTSRESSDSSPTAHTTPPVTLATRSRHGYMEIYNGGSCEETRVRYKGESFCQCPMRPRSTRELQCTCGEENAILEWRWDDEHKSSACDLSEDCRDVRFHVNYSAGTAAVKGSQPLLDCQYFWEIKMITPVYGTDMMVGVGTDRVNIDNCSSHFCSLLGRDHESWGLSYMGSLQHMGCTKPYTTKFGQGTIIGVHLDMWHGTLEYYRNRIPLGVAYTGLRGKQLYPMVCSTAARSGMRVIRSTSFITSLQFMCCQRLRRLVPKHLDVVDALEPFPPGLRAFLANNLGWLLRRSPIEIRRPSIMKHFRKRKLDTTKPSTSSSTSEDASTSQNSGFDQAATDLFIERTGDGQLGDIAREVNTPECGNKAGTTTSTAASENAAQCSVTTTSPSQPYKSKKKRRKLH